MGENPHQINEFLDSVFRHGPVLVYLVIAAACFIENFFPPFPGDSFILAAGALVGLARLDFYLTYGIIIVSGMTSATMLYALGRVYGRDYFLRKNFKFFSAADIARVERHLDRWGPIALILSRFVVGVRLAVVLAAGVARYPLDRAILYMLISYMAFAGLLMYAAMTLVDNLDRVEHYFQTYHWIVWPLVLLAAAAFIVHRYRRMRKSK
ncbi:MAG TPA: DedA family protein [Candidatus Deferrimicrobium sp.]|nr:DedA family protein [Candidatus Deferrimicrobium sp.]